MLIEFQDAVTASNLDPGQSHAVYYMDGSFANRDAVAAQCPHALLFGITVFGMTGHEVFACDSEAGDMGIDQTVSWVKQQVALGVDPIAVYANQDRWLNQGLLTKLSAYGNRIKRWVAHYDNVAVIPPWADCKQYVSLGTVDVNVARPDFFGAVPTPPNQEDIVAIAVAELQGVPHVFVEDKNGDIFYTFQKAGQNAWQGGQTGKQIAGLTFFAPNPAP